MSNTEGIIMFIVLAVGLLLMCYGLVSYDVQRLNRPVKKGAKKRDHKAEYWSRKRRNAITKYWLLSYEDAVFGHTDRVRKYRTRSEAVRQLMEDPNVTYLATCVDDPCEVKTMPFYLFRTEKAYKQFVEKMPYSRDDLTKRGEIFEHRWEEYQDSMSKANIRHLANNLSWLSLTDYRSFKRTERVVFGGKWYKTNLEQEWPTSGMEESYDLDQEAVRWRLHKVDRTEHVNSMIDFLNTRGFKGLSIYAHLVNENYKKNGETTIKVPFYGEEESVK
jgi:hypothetical protein